MSNTVKINYQKQLDDLISTFEKGGETPSLLLHSCCAPCSSYTLEYLSEFFSITVYYYNPNIYPEEEYRKRVEEQKRFISEFPAENKISFIEGSYRPEEFLNAVKGLEEAEEGGERCFICYRLRLESAARLAAEKGFDYFTTTLSISPYKNAQKLNETASELSEIYSVKSLPSDFKKKNGYKRSIELSSQYGLYRQDYCGCVFSKRDRQRRTENNTQLNAQYKK